MKRREPADPTATVPIPPPELGERCQVEDWLDPATFAPPHWIDDPGLDASQWAARCEARRRWKAARAEWLTDHDVPASQACAAIPFRFPAFANEEAGRAMILATGRVVPPGL